MLAATLVAMFRGTRRTRVERLWSVERRCLGLGHAARRRVRDRMMKERGLDWGDTEGEVPGEKCQAHLPALPCLCVPRGFARKLSRHGSRELPQLCDYFFFTRDTTPWLINTLPLTPCGHPMVVKDTSRCLASMLRLHRNMGFAREPSSAFYVGASHFSRTKNFLTWFLGVLLRSSS